MVTGSGHEVMLATYEAARCPEQLRNSITKALIAGVSTRDVATTQKGEAPGLSKSNVSRHWQSVGHKFVDELRGKDLSQNDWAILMIDGIRLRKDQLAVVAVGITADGYKHVLDFDLGSTENARNSSVNWTSCENVFLKRNTLRFAMPKVTTLLWKNTGRYLALRTLGMRKKSGILAYCVTRGNISLKYLPI